MAAFLRIAVRAPRGHRAFSSSKDLRYLEPQSAVIVSTSRTPIGAFAGALSSLSATQLGCTAVADAVKKAGIDVNDIDEAIMGNVVSANLGQAPTRQVVLGAGIPEKCPATTINKVCSSGLKSVMLAAQSIMSGTTRCVIAGGFESMSNIPFYVDGVKARRGHGYGHGQLIDGLIKDGLWDPYGDHHMGVAAEKCAADYGFSREDQDAYALESYRRANEAIAAGKFAEEIVPVEITTKKGTVTVDTDEEPGKLMADKVPKLRPAFKKDGTVTAANASSMNDGAAAFVITSAEFAHMKGLTPMARIVSMGDAAQAPIDFTTAPSLAIPLALGRAQMTLADVDFFEINEAFSVVSLANNKLLNLDANKVNVNGGAVSLGHPIGCSAARILTTLLHVLKDRDASVGVAGICNGGGGASALVVERL